MHKAHHSKRTKIVASQAREPVPTGKHRKHKQVTTKIVGSPAKR